MDKRTEKTRAAIQLAYFDLLEEGGRVTVSEIARRANIDRKTFYLHYQRVEDIIEEFSAERVQELMERLRQGEAPVSVSRAFEVMNQLVDENLKLFKVISTKEENGIFFELMKETFVKSILENFPDAFHFTETELRVYTEFYVAGIVSVYKQWVMNRLPATSAEVAEMVTKASLKGLENL